MSKRGSTEPALDIYRNVRPASRRVALQCFHSVVTGVRPRSSLLAAGWASYGAQRRRSAVGGDAVAEAGRGLDGLGVAELALESCDGDIDGAGEGVDVLVPGLERELLGSERARAGVKQRAQNGELLPLRLSGRPSRVAVRRLGSSSIPAARRMRLVAAGLRRARAWMRRTSSGK
jgi:hypothetical protein